MELRPRTPPAAADLDPEACFERGCARLAAGRPGEAAEAFAAVLAADPRDAAARGNLAVALKALGRLAEAIELLRGGLALDPGRAALWNNLGNALREAGDAGAAVDALRAAVAAAPADASFHTNLSIALRAAGRAAEAARAAREATRLSPELAHAHAALGNALLDAGEAVAAAAAMAEACRLEPRSAVFRANLGRALYERRELGAARLALEGALVLDPALAEAHANLGAVLDAAGELDAAVRHHERALELAPALTSPWLSLARAGRLGDTERLERRLREDRLGDEGRADLHFALGTASDRAGRAPEAFAHFERANALKRGLIPPFDAERHSRRVDALIESFGPAALQRGLEAGHRSELPVLVVGMPRSGTTLVEQILAAHPRVAARGELRALGRLATSAGDGERWPARFAALGPPERLARAEAYLGALAPVPAGTARAVDKMPENWLLLGPFARLFPRARAIWCRRPALEVALSCWFQCFEGAAVPYSYDLAHLASVLRDHERLMAHWRAALPIPLLELQLDALVADPERESRRLIEFLGLEWDPRCLEFHSVRRPVFTASARQVREPLRARSRRGAYAELLPPELRAALDT